MSLLKQKIHWRNIFGQIGLLLHVPAAMATFSLVICFFFREWFALLPLITLAILGFGLGQFLYRLFFTGKHNHLWDAMITAALGWVACSILAALPIWWIARVQLHAGVYSEVLTIFSHPINALFETFSGFTSTGLTMMQGEGAFPYTLQWWRSLLEWIGGIGLVVFILSLVHLNKGYQLYYAEARTEHLSKDLRKTAQWIWGIYLAYTVIGGTLFFLAGMPLWEAINHSMTVLATGGFTVIGTHFSNYTTAIQLIAIVIMVIGAISFAIHCCALRQRNWKIICKNVQLRLLYLLIILGGINLILMELWNGPSASYLSIFFEWTSALTTCGFTATEVGIFSQMAKLFLIIGMTIGGTTGSTAGGIKIRRMMYLFSAIFLRVITITKKKEKMITETPSSSDMISEEEPPGTDLPHSERSERLFTAEVLFSLWVLTLVFGWIVVLRWTPKGQALDALFDVVSALSNVGLTSDFLTPDFPLGGKCLFMFLMWVGRLEVIPALILILTLPLTLVKRKH